MALNIPNTTDIGEAFGKGMEGTSNMIYRMMQPKLKREEMAQEWKKHLDQLALSKAAAGRAEGARADAHKLMGFKIRQAEMEADPAKRLAYIQQIMQGMRNMRGQGQQSQPEQQNPMGMYQGMGMPSNEELENPTIEPPSQEQVKQGFQPSQQGMDAGMTPDEEMALAMAGIKVPTRKENPEVKRMADLQNKLSLENHKHELKVADEKTKNDLKNDQTRAKTVESAKNDLPHLEETQRALQIMKKIAEDPKNSDMFGHWWIGNDKEAQRIKNPNAGTWQTYGLGPIVEAEMKMSSRGNQLALKNATNNKPNFGEHQDVALSKINAQLDQIKRRIADTKKIAGLSEGESSSDKVLVYNPATGRLE